MLVKDYQYKVYNTSNVFLGIWDDVVSDFEYSHAVNEAGSSIDVELARNSDTKIITLDKIITSSGDHITTTGGEQIAIKNESANAVGDGSTIVLNYRVEVWVFYGQIDNLTTTSGDNVTTTAGDNITVNNGSPNGRRKFNGYITRYVIRYGGEETVLVSVQSFGSELDQHVIETATHDTTVPYNSQSPSAILQDALDKFTAVGGIVDYTGTSVDNPGTTVSYTFRLNTFLEVIKKCIELAPYDWFWWVGLGDDTVYFKQRPSVVEHYFTLGKEVKELNLEKYIEDITNVVYLSGGDTGSGTNLFLKDTDAASIAAYRQGLARISDNRVTLTASGELLIEGELMRNSEPRFRSSITILADVYDIEDISLGDLVGFRNFGNLVDDVEMQVVGLDYKPSAVTLQLDTLLPRVNKRIEDLRRNLLLQESENNPSAPS